MHSNYAKFLPGAFILASLFLTACGGGGGSAPPPAATSFSIGGSITGLTLGKSLTLRNGSENLTLNGNGNALSFTFSNGVADGATYSVSVFTQPPGLNCVVSNGSGTIAAANVNSVSVTCSTATYTIGGTVSGLTATGLVLRNNGGDSLAVDANGTFVFATALLGSEIYNVTVQTNPNNPTAQTCDVSNGFGAVGNANVTTVSVTCAAVKYSIGGTISGLSSNGLKLLNNGADEISAASGVTAFTFPTGLVDGAAYDVTVSAQPTGGITCSANNNTGTVAASGVNNVSVLCSANTWSVGGNISGLDVNGSGLVLQNNGGSNLIVPAASGVYAFNQIAEGSNYSVTVKTQPSSPSQICTVAPAGTGANITMDITADVSCVNAYTISGTISGDAAVLTDGIGPILQNNGGDNLFIPVLPASGVPVSFTFSTPVAEGATYSVTQLSKGRAPPQDCSTSNGSGIVGAGPVSGVVFTCSLTSAPSARFAYAANSTADTSTTLAPDTLSAYTIDAASGVLAASTTPTTTSGNQPYTIAVDPAGKFAYVVNKGDDTISAYNIHSTSGALTALTDVDGTTAGNQTSIATGDNPTYIALHPSGGFAYVVNQLIGTPGTLSAYSVNTTSGALSAIDADTASGVQATIATGTTPYAVSIDPFGNFAYVANYDGDSVSAYAINQTSGALTPVGSPVLTGTDSGPASIAVDPTGKCALVANNTSNDVKSYTINSTTGALTLASTVVSAVGSAPRSVAIDPALGTFAYVVNAGANDVSAYSITLPSCTIAEIDADVGAVGMTIAAGSAPFSINVDPSGQYVYVANLGSDDISVYSINPSNGALTLLQTMATGSGPTSVTTTQ